MTLLSKEDRATAGRSAHVVCWPWHLHFLAADAGHPRGDRCCDCRRDIAVPRDAKAGSVCCLYCAMDRGLVEMIDRPFA